VLTVLVDVAEYNSWVGRSRAVVVYTAYDSAGVLVESGRGHGSRRLSIDQVSQILQVVSRHNLLTAASPVLTCADCTEYDVLIRVNEQSHSFRTFESGGGVLPPAIVELMRAMRLRR
jgi:hypothetical protein